MAVAVGARELRALGPLWNWILGCLAAARTRGPRRTRQRRPAASIRSPRGGSSLADTIVTLVVLGSSLVLHQRGHRRVARWVRGLGCVVGRVRRRRPESPRWPGPRGWSPSRRPGSSCPSRWPGRAAWSWPRSCSGAPGSLRWGWWIPSLMAVITAGHRVSAPSPTTSIPGCRHPWRAPCSDTPPSSGCSASAPSCGCCPRGSRRRSSSGPPHCRPGCAAAG